MIDMQTLTERHQEHMLSMRAYLSGREFYRASEALQFVAERMHGTRKDGVTPEFHHPLSVARWVRTLPPLMYPEETMIAAFLHDLLEDDPSVTLNFLREKFGDLVADAVWLLSKKQKGLLEKTPQAYFEGLAGNPIASIVKGADRIHNLYTMPGVFSEEKMLSYAIEARGKFLPMLRLAGNRFPRQFKAYENLRLALRLQIRPYEFFLKGR